MTQKSSQKNYIYEKWASGQTNFLAWSISRNVTLTRYLHNTRYSVPAVYFDHDGAILIAWCEGLSLLRNVNTHPVEDHGCAHNELKPEKKVHLCAEQMLQFASRCWMLILVFEIGLFFPCFSSLWMGYHRESPNDIYLTIRPWLT